MTRKADEKSVKYLFRELRKKADDPEDVVKTFDNFLQKRINPSLGTTSKTYLTDNIVHQLLGEAALDEIEGLQSLPLQKTLEKIKETSNKGLKELEKSVDISPKISVKDLSSQKALGIQHPLEGIKIDKMFDTPDLATKQLGLGTLFHEVGHSFDDVSKRVALIEDEMEKRLQPDYKLKKFRKLSDKNYKPTALEMMDDQEFMRNYSQMKEALENYIKANPNKIEEVIKDPSITRFVSRPVPNLLSNEFNEFSPSKLQNLYSGGGHWFKRNFPFENLKNVLKKGIKGIKGVGIGVIPAAAAGLASAYAPDTKAETIAKTVEKIAEEGDPLSFIFPREAGEGEEEEVRKMIEEAKEKPKFKKIKEKLK